MDMLTAGAKVAPHDARVLAALAEAQLSLGKASEALESANQSLAESPSMPSAMLTQMFASAVVSGQLDQGGYRALVSARDLQAADAAAALAEFTRLSNEYPGSALVLLGRSSVLSALSRPDDALADLAAALKLNPQLVEAQAAFGLALLAQGRPDAARPWLGLASSARPWDTSLGLALGKAQLSSDIPAAMVTLRDLRDRSPWDLSILLVYGQALQASGRNEDAYRLIRGALHTSPTPELAAAFVVAAVAAGRQVEAADFLDTLADPQQHPALHQLSRRLREGATVVGPSQ